MRARVMWRLPASKLYCARPAQRFFRPYLKLQTRTAFCPYGHLLRYRLPDLLGTTEVVIVVRPGGFHRVEPCCRAASQAPVTLSRNTTLSLFQWTLFPCVA